MMASLAKAVSQLCRLGIPSEESLPVMREALAGLSREVQDISTKTECSPFLSRKVSSEDSTPAVEKYNENGKFQANGIHTSKNKMNPTSCDASNANTLVDFNVQVCQQKDAYVEIKSEYVPQVYQQKDTHEEIKSEYVPQVCQQKDTHVEIKSEYVPNTLASHQLFSSSCISFEDNHNRIDKPRELKPMVNFDHGYSQIVYQCPATGYHSVQDIKGKNLELSGNSADEELLIVQLSASFEPVHLKMPNFQDHDSSLDDVSWFFNPTTQHTEHVSIAATETSTVDHGMRKPSPDLLDYLSCGELQHDTVQHLGFHYDDLDEENLNLNSENNTCIKSYRLESCSKKTENENHREETLIQGFSSFKDSDQHDSDFEDSIHDVESRKCNNHHVEAVPPNDTSRTDVSFAGFFPNKISRSKIIDQNITKMSHITKHSFSDFDEESEPLSSHSQFCGQNSSVNRVTKMEAFSMKNNSAPALNEIEQKGIPAEFSTASQETSAAENKPAYKNINSVVPENNGNIKSFEPNEKVTKIIPENSEMEMLNSMLNFLGAKKTHVDLSTLSRHFNDPRVKVQQIFDSKKEFTYQIPESSCTRKCIQQNRSYLHMKEDLQMCQGEQKIVADLKRDSSSTYTYQLDNKSSKQDHGLPLSTVEAVECNIVRNGSQEIFDATFQDNEEAIATPISINSFEENASCSVIKNKNDKDKKDISKLLDQLLIQKQAQLRSSLVAGLKTSSRHFHSSFRNGLCQPHQDDQDLIKCSLNVDDNHGSCLLSDFDECELRSAESKSSDLVQSDCHLKSVFADSKYESLVMTDTKMCSATNEIDVNDLEHSSDVSGLLMKEPVTFSHVVMLCEAIFHLHDCHGDMADIALHVLQNQMRGKEKARFNINYIECVTLPQTLLSSLPYTSKPNWRFSTSSASVVQGLVIPCNTGFLERLDTTGTSFVTLLINADLTANFHHMGYRPTLHKRTIITRPHDQSQAVDERTWCSNVLSFIKQLNVKLLLVKGIASSILIDLCQGADVFILTNIPHHTISVVSQRVKVDILTYVAHATEANLCSLNLRPLSNTWMDSLEKSQFGERHFAVATSVPDIQTVILHCSSTMSAQLQEEKFWACLHSIANSQTDGRVLPGGGETEIWCAGRVSEKSAQVLVGKCHMQSVILDAVANIFEDYYHTVKRNTNYAAGHFITQPVSRDSAMATQFGQSKKLSSPSASKFCLLHHTFLSGSGLSNNQENSMPFNGDSDECIHNSCQSNISELLSQEMKHSICRCTKYRHQNTDSGFLDLETLGKTQSSEMSGSKIWSSCGSCDCLVYDNFQSKISAWVTAIDIVAILQNLGSLVTSGVDSDGINADIVLL